MQFYKPKSILSTLSSEQKASWNETFLHSCQEHLAQVLRMNEIVLMQSSNNTHTGYSMWFVIGETKESLIVATCQHNIESRSSLSLTTRNTQSRLKSILNGHFFADHLELTVQDIIPSIIPAEDLAFVLTKKPRGWKMQWFNYLNTKDNPHKASLAFGVKNEKGEMSLRSGSVSNIEVYGGKTLPESDYKGYTSSPFPVEDLAPYLCTDFYPLPTEDSLKGMSWSPIFKDYTLFGMHCWSAGNFNTQSWFTWTPYAQKSSALPARLIQQRAKQLFKKTSGTLHSPPSF